MRIAAAGLLVSLSLSADALRPGEVTPRVVCAASPSHSYALYLPKAYTPEKRWPVLYALDARGQGLVPLERFRAAAEEHGVVVVSSNDTRSDGPLDPNLAAVQAMLADSHARLALDDRRLYVTGFSGGARVASLLGLKSKVPFAGVIGCGGGFLEGFPPEKGMRFAWFGTAGDEDFNYVEMKRLDRRLADLGTPRGLAVFAGGHAWPPAEVAAEALDFLAVQEMRRGVAPTDPAGVAALLARRLPAARAADDAGRALEALRRYEAIVRDFDGLAANEDLAAARSRLAALRADRDVKRLLKEDERLDERDFHLLAKLDGVLTAGLADATLSGKRLGADLGLDELKRRAERDPSPAERASAARILTALFVRTSFYLANDARAAGDPGRAARALTLATEIRPRDAVALYNLACAHAVAGETKRALDALERALASGFAPVSRLADDPDLASLRGLDAYRRIVSGAGAPAPR